MTVTTATLIATCDHAIANLRAEYREIGEALIAGHGDREELLAEYRWTARLINFQQLQRDEIAARA